MICGKCKELGLKSKIFEHHNMVGCLVNHIPHTYYDEDGKYHNHTTPCEKGGSTFECSNNHRWISIPNNKCWCGWSSLDDGEEDIMWLEDIKVNDLSGESPLRVENMLTYENIPFKISDINTTNNNK